MAALGTVSDAAVLGTVSEAATSATMQVMLSGAPPSMARASRSVEAIAQAVNRDLNPGAAARVPASAISPLQETPDEAIP
jgi:3-hydroxyisobutyrate dehydrogenase-like beta-hydroxyacid dehydrogenase